MDEKTLVKIIDHNVSSGIGGADGEVSTTRQTIFDRYNGELYGNEKEGQSQITTREVFETVEWAMPSIVRVFESGDRVIEFDPVQPGDEQAAEQETDVINHIYQKDNHGFVVTHNIIKSALMNPNSYVKVYYDESEKVTTENYENLNDQEVTVLLQDPELELIGSEVTEYGYSVEVKRTCKRGKCRVMCIPEEEVIVYNNHSDLNLDDCEFVCHDTEKTHSYLLGLGYSEDDLEDAYSHDDYSSEENNRRFYSDESDLNDESHKALRKYRYQECYMLLDWDDDGIAERRRVIKVGNKIFENEEMDYMAIASASSILMPHKHTGMSLAQAVIDLQDLKTFFMRQTVNNMARVNNPRTFVNENVNLADALSGRSNGYVRVKGDPRLAASSEPIQPVIGQVLPLLDLIDQQKEGRSGITRNSMGLDADVLAKSTEGAFMGAIEKAEQRVEFIVRVFAETVFKDVFLKLHHLMLTHGVSKYMRVNGQWVMVNPSEWKKRESMTVNVGLGLGNRQQKMAAAQIIIAEQDKLVAQGAMGSLVNPQNIYSARRLLVESVGEKNVDKYFMNPMLQPPKPPAPPQPDPNMMLIQSNERIEAGKRQNEMAKLQQEAQIKMAQFQVEQAKMQFEQAKAQRANQFDQVELAYKKEIDTLKAQIAAEKNDNDAGAKAMQAKIAQLEQQLKDAQHDEKLAMDKYKADLDAETKILLKQMDANKEPEQVAQDNSLDVVSAIIAQMNRPKRVIRDENDEIIGVETE